MTLPTDDKARKNLPIFDGVLMYFPDAIIEVAAVSKAGNDQHNPGEPLHWARGKSMDQFNTGLRHTLDHRMGKRYDTDGKRHLAKAAWRALAALQLDIEEERKEEDARPNDNTEPFIIEYYSRAEEIELPGQLPVVVEDFDDLVRAAGPHTKVINDEPQPPAPAVGDGVSLFNMAHPEAGYFGRLVRIVNLPAHSRNNQIGEVVGMHSMPTGLSYEVRFDDGSRNFFGKTEVVLCE